MVKGLTARYYVSTEISYVLYREDWVLEKTRGRTEALRERKAETDGSY
jgi:hypothetical protein